MADSRLFIVNFRFQSAGDVFTTGLCHGARELGLESQDAYWDAPDVAQQIANFAPDLVFVVHGRRFAQRNLRVEAPTAVWLVDEPYETDDTASWSGRYGTVFATDPCTLHRHRNAHYLPAAFDPVVHYRGEGPLPHIAGFVGNANQSREAFLGRLAKSGVLSYIVGKGWRDPLLCRICRAPLTSPTATAGLYRQTQIVINAWRDRQTYNRERIEGTAASPRIYEALACGAAVVSEWRSGLAELPMVRTFRDGDELVAEIRALASEPVARSALLSQWDEHRAEHTYAKRLQTVMDLTLVKTNVAASTSSDVQAGEGTAIPSPAPFISERAFNAVEFSCEAKVDPGATLIAKVHLQEQANPNSNSYHVIYNERGSYLAKHGKMLKRFAAPRGQWHRLILRRDDQSIDVSIDGARVAHIVDFELQSGFCALDSTGSVELRNVRVDDLHASLPEPTGPEILPIRFTATPVRNLIYHVWPVNNSNWRWNVGQLKARIDLFNGKRIIGIVHDGRSEPPEAVIADFNGHGCEFIVRPNSPAGEAVTFPEMLGRVESTDGNEVTFYGHCKGVKYGAGITDLVKHWAEVLYQINLDDWRRVRAQLEEYPLTGAMRMLGRFNSHKKLGAWHYSGTFFWIRHALAFRKPLPVHSFYGAVEAWPGIHFRREEAGCLALDNLRQLPYMPGFWTSVGNPGVANWKATAVYPPPPSDLLHPAPYCGFVSPRLEQHPDEMAWLVAALMAAEPRRILTIGAKHGGVEWHIARAFREAGRDVEITTIEIAPAREAMASFDDIRQKFGQKAQLVHADSTAPNIAGKLGGPFDAAFIDGDHSYRGVCSDWMLARSLGARLVAFHDVIDSDWHVAMRCSVSRLWAEIKREHYTEEKTGAEWGGIGIAWLDKVGKSGEAFRQAPAAAPDQAALGILAEPGHARPVGAVGQFSPKVAIILGGAECVWDDLEKADALIAEAGATPTYFAINDMIALFDRSCVAVTLHPPKLEAWLTKRRAEGRPEPSAVWTHRPLKTSDKGYGFGTRWTPDVPGHGSSGLFAGKIAREEMGFEKILLCGVPLIAEEKHFVRHLPFTSATSWRAAWRAKSGAYAPFMRSYGGWTAELLGRPSLAFLSAS